MVSDTLGILSYETNYHKDISTIHSKIYLNELFYARQDQNQDIYFPLELSLIQIKQQKYIQEIKSKLRSYM